MSLRIHKESKIAFKAITLADMGWSGPSNQTHIGLQFDALKMLSQNIIPGEKVWFDSRSNKMRYDLDSLLIYQDQIYEANSYIAYIKEDTRLRSPKLNKTGNPEWIYSKESIYNIIENIASSDKKRDDEISNLRRNCTYWWLIYFVLDNYQLCFFLVKKDKEDSIFNKVINWSDKPSQILDFNEDQNAKKILVKALSNKDINIEFSKDRSVDIPEISSDRKPSALLKHDRKKAREAEKFVSNFLLKEKKRKKIKDFEWINEEKERLQPYDFLITDLKNQKIFSDAKFTKLNFSASFYLSKNELKLINQDINYHIYRVYEKDGKVYTRICNNIKVVARIFSENYKKLQKLLGKNDLSLITDQYSLIVSPKHKDLNWSKEIRLK